METVGYQNQTQQREEILNPHGTSNWHHRLPLYCALKEMARKVVLSD